MIRGVKVKHRCRTLELVCVFDILGLTVSLLFEGCVIYLSPWDAALPEYEHKQHYRDILTVRFSSSLRDLKIYNRQLLKPFETYMQF